MFLILKLFLQLAHEAFVSEKGVDPRTANYPLVSTPWLGLSILAAYLLFVLKYGAEFMRDRKPYNLKLVMSIFNLSQIVLNTAIFVMASYAMVMSDFNIMCAPINHTKVDPYMQILLKASYLYYLSKYTDLLDSIFFILRKKTNQLSFLHIYHHTFMLMACYLFLRYYVGSHVTLTGTMNAFVHMVMYSYYFLTSFKTNLANQLWWKKYLTLLQLAQFGIGFIHFLLPLMQPNCKVPTTLCFIGLTQALSLAALFTDFYIRAYVKPKRNKVQ